jgi:hypothetical protein
LHEAIHFAGFLTEDEIGEGRQWIEKLSKQGNIESLSFSRMRESCNLKEIWFTSENKDLIESIYITPDDNYTVNLAKLTFMKLETIGFTAFDSLKDILCVSASSLLQALMLLENQGKVFKVIGEDNKEYWCERHILARIRKQTHYKKRNTKA